MTPKEAFEKIKALFNDAAMPAMTEKVTSDGKTITCEGEFKEGSKCAMKMGDGTIAVMPDGDYTLEDGTMFTVAESTIAKIMPKEAEVEVEATKDEPSIIESMKADIAAMKSKMGMSDEDKAEMQSLKSALLDLTNKFNAFSETVKEGFKIVSQLPTEAPIETPKNNFKSDKSSDKKNKLEAIINSVQKIETN